jgi:hypothetical protein
MGFGEISCSAGEDRIETDEVQFDVEGVDSADRASQRSRSDPAPALGGRHGSAPLLADQIGHRTLGFQKTTTTHLPSRPLWITNQPASAQLGEGVCVGHRRQAGDPTTTHGDHDTPASTDVLVAPRCQRPSAGSDGS